MPELMKAEMCPCGRPLHYRSSFIEAKMRQIVAESGAETRVSVLGKTYRVSRHYIALHGLKARDLPQLAKQGIVSLAPDA